MLALDENGMNCYFNSFLFVYVYISAAGETYRASF